MNKIKNYAEHHNSSDYNEAIDRLQVQESFVALDKTDSMYRQPDSVYFALNRGSRQYELKNHLGNVLATVSDRKLPKDNDADALVDYYKADVLTASDYYPFGMQMPGRHWTADSSDQYRFGFNGMEKDNSVKGHGNSYNFGARIYDPRLGRWLTVDPKADQFPQYSPYNYSSNSPISFNDPDGKAPRQAGKILDVNYKA